MELTAQQQTAIQTAVDDFVDSEAFTEAVRQAINVLEMSPVFPQETPDMPRVHADLLDKLRDEIRSRFWDTFARRIASTRW